MPDLKAGDVIWLRTRDGDNNDEPEGHWFVVLFDLDEFDKNTVVVPIDSWYTERQDCTVRLYEGDHEIIKHESYMNYKVAQIAYQSIFNKWAADGRARIHKDRFSDALFERIKCGMGQTTRVLPMPRMEYWRRLSKKSG